MAVAVSGLHAVRSASWRAGTGCLRVPFPAEPLGEPHHEKRSFHKTWQKHPGEDFHRPGVNPDSLEGIGLVLV